MHQHFPFRSATPSLYTILKRVLKSFIIRFTVKSSTFDLVDQIRQTILEFVYVLLPMVESDDPDTIKQAIRLRRLEDYISVSTDLPLVET